GDVELALFQVQDDAGNQLGCLGDANLLDARVLYRNDVHSLGTDQLAGIREVEEHTVGIGQLFRAVREWAVCFDSDAGNIVQRPVADGGDGKLASARWRRQTEKRQGVTEAGSLRNRVVGTT